MDIVIPLGNGSKHNNLELRYALRSIEEHVPFSAFDGPGRIFIVGDRPDFIHKVIHIQAFDNPESRWKEQNIFSKIMLAISDDRLSNDFILFNDDHFLLENFEGHRHFHKGSLSGAFLNRTLHESYANTIRNTLRMHPNGLDYDVHCPMVMNKGLFKTWVASAEWHIPFGYSIQSLYANAVAINPEYHPDCKIRMAMTSEQILGTIADWKFFSIGDDALNKEMELVLQELYPHKSVYEL